MSKKKILLIVIILFIFIVGILIFMGIYFSNKEVKEVPIEQPTTEVDVNTPNEGQNNVKPSDPNNEANQEQSEITPITTDEYIYRQKIDDLKDNRHLRESPSYKFKSDKFEKIPKDDDWFKEILTDLSGGPLIKDLYKDVNNVKVYNLKETKTNFIVITISDQTFIYQMYKDEDTEKLTYKIFNTNEDTKTYVKIIEENCDEIFSKENPDGLDIGTW